MIDHWIKPKIYINNENNPKNFATGWVNLAPNKKLNKFLIITYRFEEGSSQISHEVELIKDKQLKLFKLWIKKFREIKVRDQRHTFVVVTSEYEKSYSFNSSLISFQNQIEIVINNVEMFIIMRA